MTYLTKYLSKYISSDETLLDVCCGPCNPTKELKAKSKVGIDLDTEALAIAKQFCSAIKHDVNHIETILLPASFDVVFWLDGIEHLFLNGAVKALAYLERVARKRVVVFTPTEKAFFELDNELLRHKSVFPEEFWKARGYETTTGFTSSYQGTSVPMVLAVKEL